MLLLVLASLLLCARSDVIGSCYLTYQQTVASPSQDDKCNAVTSFGFCLEAFLSTNTNLTVLEMAESLLSDAIQANPTCPTSIAATQPPEIELLDSNIRINIGQGDDVTFFTHTRQTASVANMASIISSLQGNGSAIQSNLTSQSSSLSLAAASTLAAASSAYSSAMSAAVQAPLSSLTTTQTSATYVSTYLTGNQSSIVAYRTSTNTLVETEEENLLALLFSATTNSSLYRISLQTGLNDDAADRASLSTDNSFFLFTYSTQIANNILFFQQTEDAVYNQQSSSLTTTTSTTQLNLLNNISTSFSNEIVRASSVAVIASSVLATRPLNLTGILDSTPCNSTTEGLAYYSYARAKWYFCNAQYYVSVYPSARVFGNVGGTILDYNQEYALGLAAYNYRWSLCYQLARDGTLYSTFHNNCDNKGGGLVVYQSSSGYIFGGYSEHGFTSNGVYYYSSTAFLFRFVGDTLQTAPLAGYPISNAIYHNPSAGPCFGGCDFWVGSDMRTGTSCYSSYYTGIYGYSSTWLFQTGSTSLGVATKAEIYVHVGY